MPQPTPRRLIKADSLEKFLAHRFPSAKRFGLEGAEATVPGIQAVVDAAAAVGGEASLVPRIAGTRIAGTRIAGTRIDGTRSGARVVNRISHIA